MKRFDYLSVILYDMGMVFGFLGIICLVPLIVCIFFQEWSMVPALLTAPVTFFLLSLPLLKVSVREELTPPLSVTLVSVALSWFVLAIVGALPFVFGLAMPFTESVFEAMSGWTGSGFTMITSPDSIPKSLLFWRSFTQWIGGIGIIAFGISLRRKTHLTLFRLYRSEGRVEEMVPGPASTGRKMWLIYLFLTFFFTGVVMLAGIPVWDSVNLVMVALATGGLCLHDGGLAYYNNPLLELTLIPVMLAGAFPFKLYFLMYHGKIMAMFQDQAVRVILLIAALGSSIISFDLYIFGSVSAGQAMREGIFCAVSAITTSGLQNANPHQWATVPIAIITLMVVIGGSVGSAAGGIKVNRIVLAYEGIRWWFRRFFVSSRVLVPLRFEGRTLSKEISDLEISRNMLVIVVYIITIFSATILALHLYITTFRLEEVVFEIASALSNSGISTGYISAASPFLIKWIFIFLMWLGRLEIVALLILILGLVKGFEATMTQ